MISTIAIAWMLEQNRLKIFLGSEISISIECSQCVKIDLANNNGHYVYKQNIINFPRFCQR